MWHKSRKSSFGFSACCFYKDSFFFCASSFHSESKQWESLDSECRVVLIESLGTMETDSRPELQEKASLLKKTLEKSGIN